MQELMNIYFVSHLDNKSYVSAVGLGNLIMNSLIISVLFSFNSVVETVVSQAAGTGNYDICGIYLNRAIFVNTIAFFFLMGLIMNAEQILIYLGQRRQISSLTQEYLMYYIPGIYMYGICDLYRRFLNCFQKNLLPMISFAVSVSLHPYWINHFMEEQGMGILGITAAGFVTNLTNIVIIQIMYYMQSDLKPTRIRFDRRAIENLGEFFSLGLP